MNFGSCQKRAGLIRVYAVNPRGRAGRRFRRKFAKEVNLATEMSCSCLPDVSWELESEGVQPCN